jgi:hypothetical protein
MRPGAKLFMYGFGPGTVNGVHNHRLEEPDYETVLPAAGFTISYVGSTTYQLVAEDYGRYALRARGSCRMGGCTFR